MSVLEIPTARGHDTLRFDRTTGEGVKEAGQVFKVFAEMPGHIIKTRKFGEAEDHKITSFDQAEDESAVVRALCAG
jgi:hypothetical protein